MSDQTTQNLQPIPHPTDIPLIGNLLEVDPYYSYGFTARFAEVYGEIYSLQFGGPRRLFVNTFELADEIFDEKR